MIAHIKHIANGDLTQNIEVHGRNEVGTLAASLKHMQSELVTIVGDVRVGADAIYSGASEIAAGNNDLSARTEQQAASLEETAASMEQLTATVKQNAENARQASQLALSASETAQKGEKWWRMLCKPCTDRGEFAEDCRHYQRHRRYRLPD